LISQRPSVLAVCCLGVFFQKMGYLEPNPLIKALHGYITTLRNHDQMRTCWECATNVWASFARPSSSDRRSVNGGQGCATDGPIAPRPGKASNPLPTRPPSASHLQMAKMVAETVYMEDNDSGNYSGM
jgi:hypothetical protein